MKKILTIITIIAISIQLLPVNYALAVVDTPNTFPQTDIAPVYDFVITNNYLYVVGAFTQIGGVSKKFLARIDLTTNTVDSSWPATAPLYPIFAIATDDTNIFVGGRYGVFYGYDIATGTQNDYSGSIGVGDSIYALEVGLTNTLYVGGSFTSPRKGLLSVNYSNFTNPSLNAWDPLIATGVVNSIAYDSSNLKLYIGGTFISINSNTRNKIASFDTSNNTLTSWDPNANNTVNDLKLDTANGLVYVGGKFTTIGGQTRNRATAISTSTATANSWDPNINNTVTAVFVDTSKVYLGGIFTIVNGNISKSKMVEVDKSNGTATSWNPAPNQTVEEILLFNNKLYAGGSFTTMGATSVTYLAQFNAIPEPSATANIFATVDPTISFSLSSNSCDYGSLSTSGIQTCSYTITASTNASGGYTASIRESGTSNSAFDGVCSTASECDISTTGGNTIADIAGSTVVYNSATAGTGVSTTDTGNGVTITQINDVDGGGITGTECLALDGGITAMSASVLTHANQVIAASGAPVQNEVNTVCHAASITTTTPAGSYGNTETITVTGNF